MESLKITFLCFYVFGVLEKRFIDLGCNFSMSFPRLFTSNHHKHIEKLRCVRVYVSRTFLLSLSSLNLITLCFLASFERYREWKNYEKKFFGWKFSLFFALRVRVNWNADLMQINSLGKWFIKFGEWVWLVHIIKFVFDSMCNLIAMFFAIILSSWWGCGVGGWEIEYENWKWGGFMKGLQ